MNVLVKKNVVMYERVFYFCLFFGFVFLRAEITFDTKKTLGLYSKKLLGVFAKDNLKQLAPLVGYQIMRMTIVYFQQKYGIKNIDEVIAEINCVLSALDWRSEANKDLRDWYSQKVEYLQELKAKALDKALNDQDQNCIKKDFDQAFVTFTECCNKKKILLEVEKFDNKYRYKFFVEGLACVLKSYMRTKTHSIIHNLITRYTKSPWLNDAFNFIEKRYITGPLFFAFASRAYPSMWRIADELGLMKFSYLLDSVQCVVLLAYFVAFDRGKQYLNIDADGLFFKAFFKKYDDHKECFAILQ